MKLIEFVFSPYRAKLKVTGNVYASDCFTRPTILSVIQMSIKGLFFSFCILITSTFATADTLVVSNSKAWKPFSFINDKGEPDGLLVDYWKHYGQVNQVEIIFTLSDWQPSLDAVKNGKSQLHSGLLYSDQRAQYLAFGKSSFNLETFLYLATSHIQSTSMHTPNQGLAVGVVKGGYEEEFMTLAYSNLPLVLFKNNEDMLQAAKKGEILSFVADKQVANYYLIDNNQFTATIKLYEKPIRFAVEKSNLALLEKLNQGVSAISNTELERIKQKWINTETTLPSWLIPTSVVLVALALLGYIFTLTRAIRAENRNQALLKMVNTDPLTQVHNRRAFNEILEFNFARSTNNNQLLVIIDIDYFKLVNDQYGHPIGDLVLKEVAKRLGRPLSKEHFLGRIGGEEFAVYINDIEFQHALNLVTTLKEEIADHVFKIKQLELPITISIGASFIEAGTMSNGKLLFEFTDQLLYRAKESGRNCIIFEKFQPSAEQIAALQPAASSERKEATKS